jgi:hypothetical protein
VEAVAGVGDERASVSGGAVLRLEAEAREVAAVRHQSGEGGSRRRRERTRPTATRFPFKGGRQGGSEGGFRGARPTRGENGGE